MIEREQDTFGQFEPGSTKRKRTGCILLLLIVLGFIVVVVSSFFATVQYKDLIPVSGSEKSETSFDPAKVIGTYSVLPSSIKEMSKEEDDFIAWTLAVFLKLEFESNGRLDVLGKVGSRVASDKFFDHDDFSKLKFKFVENWLIPEWREDPETYLKESTPSERFENSCAEIIAFSKTYDRLAIAHKYNSFFSTGSMGVDTIYLKRTSKKTENLQAYNQ